MMEIAALARLYPGRFLPGLGHGVASWMRQIGAFPKSQLTALEEVTVAIRELLTGAEFNLSGQYVQIEHGQLVHPPDPVPPISLGVIGPKSLALSGRVADGAILSEYASPAYITWAREQIAAGQAQAGRTHHHRLTVFAFAEAGDTTAAARETLRPMIASAIASGGIGKWHVGLEWQLQEDHVRRDQGRVNYFDPHAFDSERMLEEPGCIDYERPIIGGPTALGFDYFFGIAGSLDMPPYCFIENDRTVGIPCVEKTPYHPQQHEGLMTPGWKDEEVDVRFAEQAVAFIERCHAQDPTQPFLLYLTPSAPHRPCVPPAFLEGSSQAGPRGDMVAVVDWVVGQVMATLVRVGLADVDGRTYGHKSCGDLRGRKADIWDGGHRVPFIARWPGQTPAGSTSEAVICLSDLLATCAGLVEEPLPINAGEDSSSLLALLLDEAPVGVGRRAIVHHSVFGMFALRESRWKLIFGRGSGGNTEPRAVIPAPGAPRGQLYDMAADLPETDNVWTAHPDLGERMTALFHRYRRQGHSRE